MKSIGFRTLMLLALVQFTKSGVCQMVDAGRDTVILKGSSIKIGPTNYQSSWCFSWSTDSMPSLSDKKAPQPFVSPLKKSLYKMTVVGPDFTFTDRNEVEVDVRSTKVKFKADSAIQSYGFDDYDTNKDIPWKSVKKGGSDFVTAITSPASDFIYTYFYSKEPLKVTHLPDHSASATENVVVKGLEKGTSELQANFNSVTGANISKINIASYEEITKSVGIVRVVEENDDIQVIDKMKGMPSQTAIDPGPDRVLNSVKGGDDEVSGNAINTGVNGICESTATGDDIQVINVNKGSPNEICISVGFNNFRDTKPKGDDLVVGTDISTGPDGICNTLANDSNRVSMGITDYDTVLAHLNKTYSQSVVTWTISALPECVVNYDLDLNDTIYVPSPFMSSQEMRIIRDSCDVPGVDRLLFLVDRPHDGSLGFMGFNQKYGFIHVDKSPQRVSNTIPHELGHSLGLPHTETDTKNLMHPTEWSWSLRKNQWDKLNP